MTEYTAATARALIEGFEPPRRFCQVSLQPYVALFVAESAEEGLISRLDPSRIGHLLHPALDPGAEFEVACRGLGASPGAATGGVVLDAVHGMIAARGVLTALGGMTSHAAVVARGMGKPCVTGCSALEVDPASGEVTLAGRRLRPGDVITIEGASGIVVQR